ncbi:hypothetical protein G7Y89_g10197 [Cudoniella acicularis]|uniref:Uncharacterized protein n=1 Tax=Cudoniella acicularis TaxID=354080 RepID=A0A8H4VZA3_9HELO|nr:hypothetical protein G7Y89_g10197 [Cudoniella acicularis]
MMINRSVTPTPRPAAAPAGDAEGVGDEIDVINVDDVEEVVLELAGREEEDVLCPVVWVEPEVCTNTGAADDAADEDDEAEEAGTNTGVVTADDEEADPVAVAAVDTSTLVVLSTIGVALAVLAAIRVADEDFSGTVTADANEVLSAMIFQSFIPSQMFEHVAKAKIRAACKTGNLEALQSIFAELFPKQGAPNWQLDIWLLDAVTNGHANVVQFLFDIGAQLSSDLELYAADIKDELVLFAVFEVLFRNGLDLAATPEIMNYAMESQPLLEYLLAKGADPNYISDLEKPPSRTAKITLLSKYLSTTALTSNVRTCYTIA